MAAPGRFVARLGVVTVAAAIWRIWYVVGPVMDRIPRLGLSDEFFYNRQPRLILDGLGFANPFLYFFQDEVAPTALHPPLYSLFLTIPTALGFESPEQHRIANALLGAAVVALLGLLGRRIAGDWAGIIAAILAAVYPPLWSNDSVIGLETLYCVLVVLALLAFYRFWSAPSFPWLAAVAVFLGLASLTRSEGVVLFALLCLPAALLAPGWSTRRRVQGVGVVALVGLLIVGPWVVRNLVTFEEPTLLGTGFGLVLAYGNCDATYGGTNFGYWADECSLKDYDPDLEETEVDKLAREKGLDYIRENTRRLPVVAAARVGRIWEVFRPTQNVEFNQVYEQRGREASWAILIGFYVMLPFAIGGLVVMRKRRVPIFPMLAVAASVTITAATGFPITRYRASFDAVATVLAAVAIDAIWRHWRARSRADAGEPDPPEDPLDPVGVAPAEVGG